MSKSLAEMILGFAITGGVTGAITVLALVLARKEAREARLQKAARLSPQPVRRAS
jgi:hypothetical protein